MKFHKIVDSTHALGLLEGASLGQYELGEKSRNFIYVLIDQDERKAVLIDSHRGMEAIISPLLGKGLKIEGQLLTHSHWDHVDGLPETSLLLPSLPLYIHPRELHRIEREPYLKNFRISSIEEQTKIQCGKIEIEVLHTPGHSAGGCCFFVGGAEPICFTGDTLFIGDCGRTDLPSGSDEEMLQSLHRLRKLPENTLILPGHHYVKATSSFLKEELRSNVALRCETLEELKKLT